MRPRTVDCARECGRSASRRRGWLPESCNRGTRQRGEEGRRSCAGAYPVRAVTPRTVDYARECGRSFSSSRECGRGAEGRDLRSKEGAQRRSVRTNACIQRARSQNGRVCAQRNRGRIGIGSDAGDRQLPRFRKIAPSGHLMANDGERHAGARESASHSAQTSPKVFWTL